MTSTPAIVGGVYHETCLFPWRQALLGSGGRAACTIANLGYPVQLFSAADTGAATAFLPIAQSFRRIETFFEPLERSAGFFYSHPLADPIIRQAKRAEQKIPSRLSLGDVLYFGMIEGGPSVEAETVVYDPQNPSQPSEFRKIGTAKRLAYVLNESEAKHMTGETTALAAAADIASREDAEVVIVKRGPFGCLVWTPSNVEVIPCYRTPVVYKIGSGDVFSAVFFFEWVLNGQPPADAAHAAARATAIYCAKGGQARAL
jgi:hypothetical protein